MNIKKTIQGQIRINQKAVKYIYKNFACIAFNNGKKS